MVVSGCSVFLVVSGDRIDLVPVSSSSYCFIIYSLGSYFDDFFFVSFITTGKCSSVIWKHVFSRVGSLSGSYFVFLFFS